MRIWLCLFLAVVFPTSSSIAQRHNPSIILTDSPKPLRCAPLSPHADSTAVAQHFSSCIQKLHRRGFLSAAIDSIRLQEGAITPFGTRGARYYWGEISLSSPTGLHLSKPLADVARLSHRPIAPSHLREAKQRTLTFLENSGYPFARITTSNARIDSSTISVGFTVHPGPFITLDTLYIKGDARISRRFIEAHVGFRKGLPYSEAGVRGFQESLASLPYLSTIRNIEVEFLPNRARIYAYLTNRRANQLSGVAGFSYDETSRTGFVLTGDFTLALRNSIGQAEHLMLRWEAPGGGTQRLNIDAMWPHIAGSRLGAHAGFSLFKADSTFLNVNSLAGVNFKVSRLGSIGLTLDHRRSTVIRETGSGNFIGYATTMYKAVFTYGENLNLLLTNRAAQVRLSVGAGSRVSANADNDPQTATQAELHSRLTFQTPAFSNRFAFRLSVQSGLVEIWQGRGSNVAPFENELLRIGGNRLLRGFNQDQVLTDGYSVSSSELHLLLSQTSSFFTFFDLGAVRQPPASIGWPGGVGIGALIDTGGGVINISYAVGYGLGQQLQLRDAKIHVGYNAFF